MAAQTLPTLLSYIDGGKVAPVVDRGNDLKNPNTLAALQAQKSASGDQVDAALAASDRAYQIGEWENSSATARADMLDTIADRLDMPNSP